MPYVLINADDFGLTLGVSQGIIACDANGVQLSTSAMTCIDDADAVVTACAPRFHGGIGLHLQLTQGRPVLPDVPTLVAESGGFPDRRPAAHLDPREVAREWRAQLARLRSLGVAPDHLDSHHHVHFRTEALLRVYADLAIETGLPARSGTRDAARFLRARGVACPHSIVPISEGVLSVEAIVRALEAERARGPSDLIVEVCCHPGFVDPALSARTLPQYVATREPELKLLLAPELHAALCALGWETIRFRDLEGMRADCR
jgi:predicted glycoside hydrolase/deacetylase ChbG (UPF0249 family)